ncbi:MAG: hypothetical protein C7B45_15500 [Sulfobacillus acidophilus]|uniref:Uncharacterized protein n=1 Tax=Sulfobacillus acidophilus TaxID=53633 RepID=A0A2T2WDK0_9FIRM|nr:MAG: hypothetical protein C7B45_15500 [Sulfobacillus acidophilus]
MAEADSKCLAALDSQDEGNDQVIVNRIKNYLFRSTQGHLLTAMVETAFFVRSKLEENSQLRQTA